MMVHFSIEATPAMTEEVRELRRTPAPARSRSRRAEGRTTLVGRFGARSRARKGEQTRGRGRHARAALLRPETGLGIYDATKGDA